MAVVLLLWTATDLTFAGLCALDNEGAANGQPVSATAMLQDGSTGKAPVQQSQHIDDCFCCSHCVDVQSVVPSTFAIPIAVQQAPLVLAVPRNFGSRLYHPPLTSLQ